MGREARRSPMRSLQYAGLALGGLFFLLLVSWHRALPEEVPFTRVIVPPNTAALLSPADIPATRSTDFQSNPITITLARGTSYDVACDVPCRVSSATSPFTWSRPSSRLQINLVSRQMRV